MSASDNGAGDAKDVLSSLPRSRRQRPSARRQAARTKAAAPAKAAPAKTAAKAKPKAKASTAAKPAAKAKTTARPKASAKPRAAAKPRAVPQGSRKARTSSIPPAGYATPRAEDSRGSADPGAAIAGLVRGVLSRLPF